MERSIPRRISPQALRLVREGFLTTLAEREMALLRFVLLGYKYGPPVTRMTTHPAVHALEKAVLALNNEAHHVLEFLRFADCGEFLAAKIQPQGKVLPLVAPHFCDRLPSESFMIYDGTHGMGFLHRADTPGEFFQADQVELPSPSQAELRWQNLWKVFYRTIAVEGRENPKLRQGLCPKRFWPLMTELTEEEGGAGKRRGYDQWRDYMERYEKEKVSSWAKDAVEFVQKEGLMNHLRPGLQA